MKKEENKILYLMKIILFTMFCMLCFVTKSVYAEENDFVASTENGISPQNEDTADDTGVSTYGMTATNVEYSTEGGTWTKINDTTFTMDKDGDGATDVSLVKNGNEWQYSFTVADDKATYYGWEENVPSGYEVIGAGTRANPAVNTMTKYSHTPNISDDGVKNGNYANNLNLNDVVNIPGASKLHVALTYAGESANYDYVCAWVGSQPGYTASSNSGSAISVNGTKKFGGGNGATVEFDVEGDTVTFGYRSDGSGCGNGYGYYAVVTGSGGGLKITNKSKTNPAPETGAIKLTKKTAGKTTQTQYFKFNINLSTDNANLAKFIAGDKMYGETSFKDGSGLVYLENGGSVILDGIPSGINYTITEEPNSDYSVSWSDTAGNGNSYSGTIAANTTHEVTCTNTYTRALNTGGGSTTINPVEYGTMKLTKQFVNATGSKNAVFHIAFWNLETNTPYKYSDGANENSFTSDSTGLADVTVNMTGNQEFTFSDLPVGCKYQISEEASEYIASYEVSGAAKITQQRGENLDVNQSLTTAKETISKDDNAVITFKNTGKEIPKEADKVINVHVEKIWNDNDDAAKMRPDSIDVQLTQDGDVIATAVLDKDTNWQTDFTDLDKYAEDGVTEYDYEINEIDVVGYKSEISSSVNDKTKSFVLTNTLINTGALRIKKTIIDKDGNIIVSPPSDHFEDEEVEENQFSPQNINNGSVLNNKDELLQQEFRFIITLKKDEKPVQGVFELSGDRTGTISFDENGQSTITIKGGQSIDIDWIPAGVHYDIQEVIPSGYTEANNGRYDGMIMNDYIQTVDVKNTYNPSHKMTITKMVKGNQGDKTKQFKFQIMLTGNNLPASLDYTKNVQAGSMAVKNGIAEFTLGHGDIIVFDKMPAGVKYVITELDGESNGYTVENKNANGTVNSDKTVEFTNTKNVGIPTAAVTNTAAIAGVVAICIIGVVVIMIKKKKKAEK